jgi:hypothetical protein
MKTLKAKENLDKCSGRNQLSIAVEFWVSYIIQIMQKFSLHWNRIRTSAHVHRCEQDRNRHIVPPFFGKSLKVYRPLSNCLFMDAASY